MVSEKARSDRPLGVIQECGSCDIFIHFCTEVQLCGVLASVAVVHFRKFDRFI